MRKNTKKEVKIKDLIRILILLISFGLAVWSCGSYLNNNTSFFKDSENLLKSTIVSYNFVILSISSIGLFILYILLLKNKKDVGRIILYFIWELFFVMASALFIMALTLPNLYLKFRLIFVFNSFIVYYTVSAVKNSLEKR